MSSYEVLDAHVRELARIVLRCTAAPRPALSSGCLPDSTKWKRAELGLSILLTEGLQYSETFI